MSRSTSMAMGSSGVVTSLVLGDWGTQCNPFWDEVDVQFVGDMMVVTTTGLPTHQIGPFDGSYDPDTGRYCVNPNTATVQNDVWMIPLQPNPTNNPAVDVLSTGGPIAVSITGAALTMPMTGVGAWKHLHGCLSRPPVTRWQIPLSPIQQLFQRGDRARWSLGNHRIRLRWLCDL